MAEIDLAGLKNLVKESEIEQNTKILSFSLPVGFTPYMQEDPHVVLHAVNQAGYVLMVYASDPLEKYRTLDMGIEEVKMRMILAAHETCGPGQDIPPFHVNDVQQNGFLFKVYMFDSVGMAQGQQFFQRKFAAFFLEPKTRCFYQIILSSPLLVFPPDGGIIPGRYNLSSPDPTTLKMLTCLESVIKYVMYRSDVPTSNLF